MTIATSYSFDVFVYFSGLLAWLILIYLMVFGGKVEAEGLLPMIRREMQYRHNCRIIMERHKNRR